MGRIYAVDIVTAGGVGAQLAGRFGMIDKTISHYKILKKLGEGGMGEVYLAEDTQLERKVAIKLLPARLASNPEVLERFQREAKAAAALNHPNIVTVHEVSQHEDRPFIAMAYVEGELLRETISRKEMPISKAIDLVVQVCDGLGKAHESGIVHRDIKPENIIVDTDGRAKILDFGLATRDDMTRITQTDSTVGTLKYMSPEQARGEDVDRRSDIFSLGAVLYEMIAGRSAFSGDHSAAVLFSIANDKPQPLSRFNNAATTELERIVSKALAKKAGDRYQSTADLAVDLRHALDAKPRAAKTTIVKFAVPAAAVLLTVVLFAVFKPFSVEIVPEGEVQAAANKLAIMYFENMVEPGDPQRLGEIITDLLITNLSRSSDLQVVSSQRLYDLLKLEGKEGVKIIDRSTATQVAMAASAKWMMQGRILQVAPHFVVTSQLVDMASGNVITSQRVSGEPGETIFAIVDRMTGDARGDLNIPVERSVEVGTSVTDVTTRSLAAYRHYIEGKEHANKHFIREARESFKKAIAADSTFAMAYLGLGSTGVRMSVQESMWAIQKAMELAAKVTRKERLYIQAQNGFYTGQEDEILKNFQAIIADYPEEKDAYQGLANYYKTIGENGKAAEAHEKILELDPMSDGSYNELAYIYQDLGEFDKSLWAINKYIELVPDEPNPYDSRGDLYAYDGRLDEAIESYQKAIEIKPDFDPSAAKLGHMYLFKGDYEKAEARYRVLLTADRAGVRSAARFYLAAVPIFQGQFERGLQQLDLAIAADELEDFREMFYVTKRVVKTSIYTLLERPSSAIAEGERVHEALGAMIEHTVEGFEAQCDLQLAGVWARNGRLADSKQTVARLDSVGIRGDSWARQTFFRVKGLVASEEGDTETAIRSFEQSNDARDSGTTRFLLGRAYLAGGRIQEAIETLEAIERNHSLERVANPLASVQCHYYLGLAYQESGQLEKAAGQYDRFLTLWSNADPVIHEVTDARERLDALRQSG